jgi:hypothetical protein
MPHQVSTIWHARTKAAFGEPKTAHGKRNIALDGVTIGVLRTSRAQQAQERLAFRPTWQANGPVFTGRQ